MAEYHLDAFDLIPPKKPRSAQVAAKGGKRVLTDGPFAETKELLGGFFILDVSSLDAAVAWMLHCPTGLGFDDVLDIRPLTGVGNLPPEIAGLIQKTAPAWTAALWSNRR